MNLCVEKQPCDNKEKGFFRRNLFIILSFLGPALVLAAVYALRSYYPFGNRLVIISDGWHQYYPFLTEYQQMLKEGSSAMYSWNIGGGVNFLGVIANYIASPLYLLTAFIPSGSPWLALYLAFTIVVRVGFAGMFFGIFIRKVFKRNDISLVAFAMMYALCAYAMGYYWNTMWLDTFALLPLVTAGVVGVIRDNKFSLYIISLVIAVLCSFYIGYMVCLFVLVFSIGYTIVSFVNIKDCLKNAGRMFCYTLVAFMMTAVLTIPTYIALRGSDSAGSATGFPAEYSINYGYGFADSGIISTLLAFAKTATNMLSASNPIRMDQGEPNIACGILALVLIPFYFVTKKISIKEKIVSLALILFFLAGFVVDQLNYIWHAFATPAMVYYRWSFIFSFAILVLAYRAYTLIEFFSKKAIIASSVLLALYFALAFFLQNKISLVFTAVGAGVVLGGLMLYKAGRMKLRTLSLALCLFAVCDMSINCFVGVRAVGYTKTDNYPMDGREVEALVDVAYELSEDEMFRTEFLKTQTLNDGALNSVYGISTFNSMVDSSYADVLKEMGLAASMVNNRYVYLEGTPVTNLFLNIKYLIGRDSQQASDETYLKPVATAGKSTLYEATEYLSTGFMVQKELLNYSVQDSWRFPGEALNEIFSLATGIEEDVFVEVNPLQEIQCNYPQYMTKRAANLHSYQYDLEGVTRNPENEKITSATVESSDEKKKNKEDTTLMTVEYEITQDGAYYGLFRSSTDDETVVIINDGEPRKMNQSYSCMVSVGTLKKGDRVRVEMEAEFSEISNINYRMARVDEDVFERGVDMLGESTMELTRWSDTEVSGTIDVNKDGLFYTSVLYCEGWKAYVDGTEVEITPVADTFIAFELPEGEHEIKLEFKTPGLKAGIIISVVGIVDFVLLCVGAIMRKKKKSVVSDVAGCDMSPSEDTGSTGDLSMLDTD